MNHANIRCKKKNKNERDQNIKEEIKKEEEGEKGKDEE